MKAIFVFVSIWIFFRSLQRTLKDLKDYQRKHDLYQTQSDKLLAEQVPHEVKVSQLYAYEQVKARERSADMGKYYFTYKDQVRVL